MPTHRLPFVTTLAFGATALAQTYTITDLGPIAPEIPFSDSFGADVNNAGDVTGASTNAADVYTTTLWLESPKHGMSAGINEIPSMSGSNSRAYGMNDLCQLTGFEGGGPTTYTPFLWDPVTGMVDLGALGATNGIGRAINNAGFVVGEMDSVRPNVYRDAFLYDGAQVVTLDYFDPIGFQTRAEDINELGQVCGYSTYSIDGDPDGEIRAALWLSEPAYGLPAGVHDIDDLSTDPFQISVAKGMNDLGQVVVWGTSIIAGSAEIPFWLWLPEPDYGLPAGMNDLGFAVAPGTCFAQAINNRGEVVSRTDWDPTTPFGDWRATLWRQGEWIDLNTRIPVADQQNWFLEAARDINEAGQITGEGWFNGEIRGFLLTPVVEPLPNTCTADITGPGGTPDGTVDALDYLLLIGQWGSPCTGTCEADITGPDGGPDGNVDALDFLELIGLWGDCPVLSTGSCCFDLTGDCQQLSASDCAFMGGTFTPGADCDTTDCGTPTGACCIWPWDECTTTTEWACGLLGDTYWLGPGTDCATDQCPAPPTGDRIENPFVIDALPYSTVASTAGARDDYDLSCPVPSGASDKVYAYTPTQDETITISLCGNTSYDSKVFVYEDVEGNDVACNDDACSTAVITDPWVSKIDFLHVTAGHTYYIIIDGYGVEAGMYTLDVDAAPPVGACCLPDETCFESTEQPCLDAGGNWLDGSVCADCPALPRGACCLPGGVCVANQLEYECVNDFGGVWQGAGTSCFGANCP
jgi:uncharacterized membrane protein